MNRAHVIRAAWYLIKATDERPSRRAIQELIKFRCGKTFHTNEVAAWLKDNQILGEGRQPYLRPDPEATTFSIEGIKPARARDKEGKSSLVPLRYSADTTPLQKNGQIKHDLVQSGYSAVTSRGDQEKERSNIKDGSLHSPSSRGRACDATMEEKNRETTRTSAEGVKPATTLPIFESGDEARVQRLLGAMAAEAPGGVTPLDEAALRTAMHRALGAVGPERWRYGMEIALVAEHAGLGNRWRYAQGVMKRHKTEPTPSQNGKPRGGAAPRHSITPERKAEIDAWAAELDAQGQRAYEARVEARRKAVASD
jgi:hypothetical protein